MSEDHQADLELPPITRASGILQLPGSKSISNRVLLLAALSEGQTRLKGLLDSQDTQVMIAALRQLGTDITENEHGSAVVCGAPFLNQRGEGPFELYLANAGTAVRPLAAVLAVLGIPAVLSGVPRMHERPIKDLVCALRKAGAQITYLGNEGYPPIQIASRSGKAAHSIQVKGDVSSQFLTAVLMAAPLLAAQEGRSIILEVQGELISKPYILITLRLMALFGVEVAADDLQRFEISPEARYRSPGDLFIEGDASSASYFMAMGLLGQGPIKLRGITEQSIQGDIAFAAFLQKLGAQVEWGSDYVQITAAAQAKPLPAFDEDFNLIPDAAMTAAVLALFADGPCCLRNIGSWRVKETDRLQAMQNELRKLGAQAHIDSNSIRITPPQAWQAAAIDTYDDHRMAMCFSLAAFGPVPVTIKDPGCVRKTFPDYFSCYRSLCT